MKHIIKIGKNGVVTKETIEGYSYAEREIKEKNIKNARQRTVKKLYTRLAMSLFTFWVVLGANIYVFANIDVEEQYMAEFEQVLLQEEVTQEDVNIFVDHIQEMVDVDTSIFPQDHITDVSKMVGTEEESSISPDEKVINEAIAFIKKFEWVRYEAYFDFKQYSICFGTKSFKWEKVNAEECDKRLKQRVQSELLRVNRLADGLQWNKKAALISFFYNTGFNIDVLNYAMKWDDKSVVFLVSQYNVAWGKYKKGLASRRAAEISFYKTWK